jgi:hypothetical protein
VHVFWLGFEDADATWEPLAAINEDVPEVLGSFLDRCPKKMLVDLARQTLVN